MKDCSCKNKNVLIRPCVYCKTQKTTFREILRLPYNFQNILCVLQKQESYTREWANCANVFTFEYAIPLNELDSWTLGQLVWVSKAQQNGRPVICSRGARARAVLMMGANVISSSQQSAELRFSAVALTPLDADPDSPRPLTAYLSLAGITLHLVPWRADSLAICRVSALKPACVFPWSQNVHHLLFLEVRLTVSDSSMRVIQM